MSPPTLTDTQARRIYVAMFYIPPSGRLAQWLADHHGPSILVRAVDERATRVTRRWADHYALTGELPPSRWLVEP